MSITLISTTAVDVKRPEAFFEWVSGQSHSREATDVVRSARQYLPVATWQWDKACILAGALLGTTAEMPGIDTADSASGEFPYWVALDKHTPEGKVALREVAKQVRSSYRQVIWASFYFESTRVNRLLPSPWWDAEKRWRLGRAGLSVEAAEELWLRLSPLVRERLESEAASLKQLVEAGSAQPNSAIQSRLI